MPRKSVHVVATAGLLLLAVACSSQKEAAPAGAAGAPAASGARAGGAGRGGRGGGPVPVVTGHVQTKAIPVTIPAVGTAEALSTVQIRAQVTGQLSAIHFAEGQEVRKGQTLFTLDQRPFQAALQQAQAVLARDTATAKNSQSQQARYEDLYKRGLIARDQYESQSATASAQQATLAADQAAVETAQLNLQYTTITAPLSGRAGALTVHQGDLIRANDPNPLLVINQMAPIYVGFSVPGRFLEDIRRYQARRPLQVQARLQGSPTGPTQIAVASPEGRGESAAPPPQTPPASVEAPAEAGIVSFIDNAVDPTTGTIKLKASFPNTSHRLWPGLFVQVTLLLTTDANALVVPSGAVQDSQQGTYVYVVKPDRTAEMRPVRVERQQGERNRHRAGAEGGRGGRDRRPSAPDAGGAGDDTVGERRARGRRPPGRTQRRPIMNVAEPFIERPVATTLLVTTILIFGVMGYRLLPVSDLPTVDFPTIQVEAGAAGRQPRDDGLVGGDAAREAVLDDRRHHVDQLDEARRGSTSITLQFDLSRNIDAAAQDVQSTIARAQRSAAARHAVAAVVPEDQPGRLSRSCSWSSARRRCRCRRSIEYAETVLAQRLSMVTGVAQVNVFGAQKYAVRVDSIRRSWRRGRSASMRSRRRSPARTSNRPTGTLYGPQRNFVVQAQRPADRAPKATSTSSSPIATAARCGSTRSRTSTTASRTSATSAGTTARARSTWRSQRQPGTNTVEVVDAIKELLPELPGAAAGVDPAGDPQRPL